MQMEIQKTCMIRYPLCKYCSKEVKSLHSVNLDGIYFHIECLNNLIQFSLYV